MKVKLLRRLRQKAMSEVTIYSITKTNGEVTGMRYGYHSDCYEGVFSFGDTEDDVMKKVVKIYFENNIDNIRKKYKKYSRQRSYN